MPEDFDGIQGKTSTGHQAARIANAKLEKLLGPEVFGYANTSGGFMYVTDRYEFSTHTARLFNVQPIERKDTAEQLVKDLAGHAKYQYDDSKWAMNAEYWVDRARKLLEDK